MRVIASCVCAVGLAALLGAQTTIVSPAHFNAAEGNHWWGDPVGSGNNQVRYLQIHDDLQGHPRIVNGLAFRLDEDAPAAVGAFSIFVSELWCSTAAPGVTAAAPNPTFAANHGQDRTRVSSSHVVNFPASPPPDIGLARPFTHRIPFQVPFNYLGQGPLCWEISVTGRTNPPGVFFDSCYGVDSNSPPYSDTFGTGCRASGRTVPFSLNVAANNVRWNGTGSFLRFTGSNAAPNSFVFCHISTNNTSFGGGLLLPFLLPGTPGAPSGACTLYTDSLVTLVTLANSAGDYLYDIANDRWLVGSFNSRNTFYQSWGLDPNANAYGVILSNAVRHHWVAPIPYVPIARVWALLIAPTGTAGPLSGSVVQFF